MPKSIRIHPKSIQNLPKSTKMVPRSVTKRIVKRNWFRDAILEHHLMLLAAFRCHLDDFWRHFGSSWAPRESQNPQFWYQGTSKIGKMRSREANQKRVKKKGCAPTPLNATRAQTRPPKLYIYLSIWLVLLYLSIYLSIDLLLRRPNHTTKT